MITIGQVGYIRPTGVIGDSYKLNCVMAESVISPLVLWPKT
jgi:hypothetical protein